MYFDTLSYIYHRFTFLLPPHTPVYLPAGNPIPCKIASNVEKRTAFALPVFRIERFAGVMSIFSASSPKDIFLRAIIMSRFTIIIFFTLKRLFKNFLLVQLIKLSLFINALCAVALINLKFLVNLDFVPHVVKICCSLG